MPFGFNKPSRSYVNTRSANYDSYTGYPTGQDESRGGYEYAYEQARGRNREESSYGYDERDHRPASRVSKKDYGGSQAGGSGYMNGTGQASSSVSRNESTVKRKVAKKVIPEPEVPVESSKKVKHRVSFQSPYLTPDADEPISSTPSAADYFKPRKTSSAVGISTKASSSLGKMNGNGDGKKRRTKSMNVQQQLEGFSVLDLAPPAPKPKGKGKQKATDDATSLTASLAREAEERHPHMHVEGMLEEDVGELARRYIDVDALRPEGHQRVEDSVDIKPTAPSIPVERADDRGHASEDSDDDVSQSSSRLSVAELSQNGANEPIHPPPIVIPVQTRVITPEPVPTESTTLHIQNGYIGSAQSSRSPSPAPSSQSRTRSQASSSEQRELSGVTSSSEYDTTNRSRQDSSYDTHSPWNPAPLPYLPNAPLGFELGPAIGARPQSSLSRTASVHTTATSDRETLRAQSTVTDWERRDSVPASPVRTQSGSSNESDKQAKKSRPVAGVSRSYKGLAPAEESYMPYVSNAIQYDDEQEATRPASLVESYRSNQPEAPTTPNLQNQGFSLAPPLLAVQPPTPLRDELANNPMSPPREQFEDAVEDDASVRSIPVPATATETNEAVLVIQAPPGKLPVEPFRDFAASPSASSSNKSSPSMSGSITLPAFPPPPSDPTQPAVLRWDPQSQRWLPGHTPVMLPVPNSHRAESVVSSVSAYSQASHQPPTSGHNRRQSLPSLKTTPSKGMRRGASPAPSPLSRPTSPANSRPSSVYGNVQENVTTPPMGYGFAARRMSIEPAYQLSPTTLTLLPEMHEPEMYSKPISTDTGRSRPPSRASSIRSDRMTPHVEPFRAPSNVNTNRWRNSVAFPSGYDINQRLSAFGPSSRESSDNGDEMTAGESRYYSGQEKARAQSMGATSLYSGSVYDNGPYEAISAWRKPEKLGQESVLDSISVRGDPVPLLGADGSGQDGRGGYNAMILPTGAYTPVNDPTKNSGKLDARVLGMPNTTMSTITLSGVNGLSRKSSLSGVFGSNARSPTPAHLVADLPPPVSFSAHQAPPSKISPSQVLVQVYAVALDRFDFDMVREKSEAGSGAGKWVPGRSYVGRALDVGADVRVILKGDMVMGLVDIKKVNIALTL